MAQNDPHISVLRTIAIALAAVLLAAGPAAAAAPTATDGRPVQTETIVVPPDSVLEPAMPTVPPDSGAAPAASPGLPSEPAEGADQPPPEVQYDLAKLPVPVARLREQIIEAAATGDLEKLRPIIEASDPPPQLSFDRTDDPIAFLKSSSGDEGGREILAILIEVLEAGYVHVGAGTRNDMYVWPYFTYYPVEKLTPRQLVELFKLVYAGDYEDMRAYGGYIYYRVGISPDGQWRFFVAGD